jgi:Pregnancy-associated plasma protein-A/SprB repeat/HYR domain
MNRITTLLVFLFFQSSIFGQANGYQFEVPAHAGKAAPPGLIVSGKPVIGNPAVPVCAFDEFNQQLSEQNPVFAQELQQYLDEAVPLLSSGAGQEKSILEPLLSISVVVHVIHSGEPVGTGENISDEQVQAQIAILNEDYTALNPQFYNTPAQWTGVAGNPNIEFCLASVDPAGNPANGITRHNLQITGSSWSNNNINSVIKPATNWAPTRYFNIYVLPIPGTSAAGGVVGFSNYPAPSLIGAAQDGVVIDYRWFGAPGFGVSGWRPLTHETGHYLGLPHPFKGNSCSADDGIADTPNIDKPTREYATLDCTDEYPPGPVSCGNEHLYENYMDYVTENCYTSFTGGQANVVRAVLDGTSSGYGYGSRQQLIANAPNQCNLAANDAGIIRFLAPAVITCTTDSLPALVTLRNFGVDTLMSVLFISQIDANPTDTFQWQGGLFPGGNLDVELPAFLAPEGSYDLTIHTESPNAVADERPENDTISVNRFTFVAVAPPLFEDFENEPSFPTGGGLFGFNVNADDFVWQLDSSVSAFGTGTESALFDNFAGTPLNNPLGTIDALITRHYDLTEYQNTELHFDLAYAPFSAALTDTLLVMVATDCSQIFNEVVFVKGGETLATAPATQDPFVPSASQWRTESIDLSNYDGATDITLAFVNLSGWGNRLYLDNIRLGQACSTLTTQMQTTASGCTTCDGGAVVTPSGGNGSFLYQWEYPAPGTGQSAGNVATLLCPGMVTVTVTDAFGCTNAVPDNVGSATGPSGAVTATGETSYAAEDGTATVTPSGGVPPYNFTWSNSATTASVSNLAPGGYWVVVEDGQGCDTTINFVIAAFDCGSFAANVSVNAVTCFGGNDGTLTVLPAGGTSPYSYLWSNGSTAEQAAGLTAGTYFVTVTDDNGCPVETSGTVSQPAQLLAAATATNETANNAQNGTATASGSGGTPGYTYLWNNGAATSFVSNLAPGTYTVTVTDAAGCTATASVTVQAFSCAGFQPVISSTDVTCFGSNDGTATVTPSGGTPGYNFAWGNGQTTQTLTNLPAGTYPVTVTDGAGCTAQLPATIAEPAQLVPNATATDETSAGANDGTASVSPSGGTPPYAIFWSNGSGAMTITNLPPGNYTATIVDGNNCQAVQTVTVAAATGCSIAAETSSVPASCPNVADGSAEVTSVSGGAAPYDYLWSNGSTTFFANNLVSGTYTVTITDANQCTVVTEVEVESMDITPPVLITQPATVYLDGNGIATVDGDLVASESFDNCSLVFFEVNPAQFDCQQLGTQEVTITATDASGNSASGVAQVVVADDLPPVLTCPGDLTVDFCQGVVYDAPMAVDNCTQTTLALLAGVDSGGQFPFGTTTVEWRATDDFGNASTCSFQVTVANDLTIDIVDITAATGGLANGQIDYSVSGGSGSYDLAWYENGLLIPGFDPAYVAPGTYQLEATDAGGCTVVSGDLVVENSTGTFNPALDRLIRLYPNPAKEKVFLRLDGVQPEQIVLKVSDVTGRVLPLLPEIFGAGGLLVLDFGGQGPGIYFIRISIGDDFTIKQVVIF